MSKESVTIFGLKEDPRPKGHGCIYLSHSAKTDGLPLAYFDFYQTTEERFRQVLMDVLPKVLVECTSASIQLVNFKPESAAIFRDVASCYTSIAIVSVETEKKLQL
jgi:hypothetical protein